MKTVAYAAGLLALSSAAFAAPKHGSDDAGQASSSVYSSSASSSKAVSTQSVTLSTSFSVAGPTLNSTLSSLGATKTVYVTVSAACSLPAVTGLPKPSSSVDDHGKDGSSTSSYPSSSTIEAGDDKSV